MSDDLSPAASNNRKVGLSRRTVLKTAAWSTPVIAMAAATPAFAASGGVNLVWALGAGSDTVASNADNTRRVSLPATLIASVANLGDITVPGGSILTVMHDIRWAPSMTASVDGVDLTPTVMGTTGNLRTTTFLVPMAIPASPSAENELPLPSIRMNVSAVFPENGNSEDVPFHDDFETFTLTLDPPSGLNELDPSNNGVVRVPVYEETYDLIAQDAVWVTQTIEYDGSTRSLDVPREFSITTAGAGAPASDRGMLSMHLPSEATQGVRETAATLTSVTVNGISVANTFVRRHDPVNSFHGSIDWDGQLRINPGDVVKFTFDIVLDSVAVDAPNPGSWVKYRASGNGELNESNNQANSPDLG